MSVNLIAYRNKTRDKLHLLVGAEKFEVGPLDEILFTATEAELAEIKYGDVLEKVPEGGLGTLQKDRDPEAPIYIANMSGNPDAPEKIATGTHKNKMTGLEEIRYEMNMLAVPRDYHIWRRPKPERVTIGSSTVDRKLPKKKYSVEVGKVTPFAPKLAGAFFRSAASLNKNAQGWIIASRPQDFYKPDDTWAYDEIVMWLDLVKHDFHASEYPTEGTIRQDAGGEVRAERKVYEAKRDMLKRVFFVAADPQYVIPSRSEFEAYLGKNQDVVARSESSELTEKVVEAATVPKKKRRSRKTSAMKPATSDEGIV